MPTQFLGQGDTIITQGRFVSTGVAQFLPIPSGFSWVRVFNETAAIQNAADLGYDFYWQQGMPVGQGFVAVKLGTQANDPTREQQIAANSGFTPFVQGSSTLSAPVAITAGTNATRPVYSTANTAGLANGSIVRLSGTTGQLDMSGYDWAIDTLIANTSFRIAALLQNAPGAAATAGFYRIVNFAPLFYPPHRFISGVAQGATTVIGLTVPSGYAVGQAVRVYNTSPEFFGMPEINGLQGTIVAVNDTLATQTITLNIDSTAFTPFTWPLGNALGDYSPAIVVPVGMDTAYAVTNSTTLAPINILSDAVTNTGQQGVILAAGINSPGGQIGDVLSWTAGASYSNIVSS